MKVTEVKRRRERFLLRFVARINPHRRERTELRRIIGCIASLQEMRSTKTGRQLRRVLGLTLKYNYRDDLQAKFLGGWDDGYILAEMMFLLLLAILAIFEVYQVSQSF